MTRLWVAILCLLLLACGSSSAPVAETVSLRAPTAGQSLLASAPLGADLLLEVNLQRLRENPVVGGLLAKVAPPDALENVDLLQQADVALLLVYDVGTSPRQLVILRSREDTLPGAVALGEKVFAVGDEKLLALAAGIQGPDQSMLADRELLRLSDAAMPGAAKDASLRLALRLDFDARVSIASKVNISEVPTSVAVWGDVVDDLAVIAYLGSDEAADSVKLEGAIRKLRGRIAAHPFVRSLGLGPSILKSRIMADGKLVKVLILVSPKRLQSVVTRLLKQLSNQKT